MAKKSDAVMQVALKAIALGEKYGPDIAPRLPAGALESLAGNVGVLSGKVADQVAARQGMKSATVSQAKALENTALIVSAIRGIVKAGKADKATLKAYGVGDKLSPKVPKSVAAAAAGIIAAWNKSPDVGRALGVLDADIAALTASAAAARAADEDQDQKRVKAPQATKQRDAALKAVQESVQKIAAVGALHFATNAKVRAEFEALTAGGGRKKRTTDPAPAPA